MKFCVLGAVCAIHEKERIPLSGSKINTVLGALILARGKPVSYDQLSEYLWGWSPPASMNAQLYTYAYKLRKALRSEVNLTRRHTGYQLDLCDSTLDLAEFETEVERGRAAVARNDLREASRRLAAGLSLWQGSPLNNVTEFLADVERTRLEEAYLTATELRAQVDLELGEHDRLLPELTKLTAQYPLREQFRAQLIHALDRSDRRGEALLVFHEARRVLADELGVDPGPALTAAYQAALSDTPQSPQGPHGLLSGPATVSVTTPPAADGPTVLPAVSTLVGREDEWDRAARVLAEPEDPSGPRRLLIDGRAGSGKTTLAVQLAHDVAERFPDGRILAEMTDGEGRPSAIKDVLLRVLRALGHDPGPRRSLRALSQAYRMAVAGRRVLVVLDDVVDEHLLEQLIPTDPGSAVIMTSRYRLSTVRSREVVTIDTMEPFEGIMLLAEVAGSDRVLADEEAAKEVVRHCDHCPATVRIAGATLAQNPQWSVRQLARLMEDPQRRLDELGVGRTSLRDHLSSEVRRLPPESREVFCEMAVTDSDVDARALGSAPSSPIPVDRHLRILIGASLVEQTRKDAAGRAWFRVRESVRPLAEQLTTSESRI